MLREDAGFVFVFVFVLKGSCFFVTRPKVSLENFFLSVKEDCPKDDMDVFLV